MVPPKLPEYSLLVTKTIKASDGSILGVGVGVGVGVLVGVGVFVGLGVAVGIGVVVGIVVGKEVGTRVIVG